jgi:hypothetical protein
MKNMNKNLINISFNSKVFNSFDSTNKFIILGYDFILDKHFTLMKI